MTMRKLGSMFILTLNNKVTYILNGTTYAILNIIPTLLTIFQFWKCTTPKLVITIHYYIIYLHNALLFFETVFLYMLFIVFFHKCLVLDFAVSFFYNIPFWLKFWGISSPHTLFGAYNFLTCLSLSIRLNHYLNLALFISFSWLSICYFHLTS